MVWLIVLGLPTIIGVMVAYLTFRGREVRDYGHEVLLAAKAHPWPASASGEAPCRSVLDKPLPRGALTCQVQYSGPNTEVVITVEGNRQYRVSR